MAKILVIFPKEYGGEWVANKNISHNLYKIDNNILIKEVSVEKTIWDKNGRLQLLKSFLKQLLKYRQALISLKHKDSFKAVYSSSLIALFLASFFLKKETSLFFHFHGQKHFTLKKELEKEKNFFRRWFYIFPFYWILINLENNFLYKKFKKIFVPAKNSVKDLLNDFPSIKREIIKIIPNGIDEKIFNCEGEKKLKNNNLNLLFVGRLEKEKGVTSLIEAFNLLKNKSKYENLTLTIVYQNSSNRQFQESIIRKAKQRNINLISNLNQNKLAILYKKNDLLILPSLKEQASLVFLESIACGTPVLSTLVGNLEELQMRIDSRMLLKTDKAEEIALKIINYFKMSPRERKNIFNKGLKLSENYRWLKTANLIYQEIING